jgi:hypothetical protein
MLVLCCRDHLSIGGIGVRYLPDEAQAHVDILRREEAAAMGVVVEEEDGILHLEEVVWGVTEVEEGGIVGDMVVVVVAVGEVEMGGVIVIVHARDHEVRIGIQGEIGVAEGGDEVRVIAVFQVGVLRLLQGGEVGLGVGVPCRGGGEIGV